MRGIVKEDLRRARRGQGVPVQESTHMLIVGVVCDHGVRGVLHEGAFEPLDELALEATDVSNIEMDHGYQEIWKAQGIGLTSSVAVLIP